MKTNTKIHFLGGAEIVTGSNFYIEKKESEKTLKVLVDCGLFQGCAYCEADNKASFSYDPCDIEYLFVTHAHIDHIGRIPRLVKSGFSGKIISTRETKEIAPLMFADAISVMRSQRRDRDSELLYEEKDVANTMALWQGVDYCEELSISKDTKVSFLNSGHILGSAMVVFRSAGKTLVFTGDLGNENNPLLPDPEKLPKTDFLVMESVYGDRNHESTGERVYKLKGAIQKAIEKKGPLIIPTFSLERMQNLLFEINNLVESKVVPALPLYVDSPLAIKLTEIYKEHTDRFNNEVKDQIKGGDDIFNFPNLRLSFSREESEDIYDEPDPKVILAGSGMSSGGRVVHHEKKYLSSPATTLLSVGYQSAGSLGRRLEEGVKEVEIEGEKVKVRAEILKIEGYSSHMDGDHLFEFVSEAPEGLSKVFVVMGEPKASNFLANRIKDNLNLDASAPAKNSICEIEF